MRTRRRSEAVTIVGRSMLLVVVPTTVVIGLAHFVAWPPIDGSPRVASGVGIALGASAGTCDTGRARRTP